MEAVGRLAGGVAHDFNNLLMVINGFSELLVERLPPGEELEAAQQIHAAGDRAAELTRQLLTFAEVGLQRLEVVDVAELLTEFLPELRRVVGDSIDIAVDVSADRPSIEVDRGQLRQAFHNLVVNARDAMSGSGRLAITLEDASPDLETSIEAPAGALLVSVVDSGPGIPDANRERVFLPFFTTHADRGATGLGLALVFATVRGAGGRVWVERAAGPGTVIRLLVPRAAGGPAQPPGRPPAD
jgi:signal transduction histidine kinase